MDELSDIRNWRRRPDGITTSGRLEPGDPARLAALGVRHVINLALDNHPEALANEARLVRKAGMAYTHIPVPFDAPKKEHVDELAKELASKFTLTAQHKAGNKVVSRIWKTTY